MRCMCSSRDLWAMGTAPDLVVGAEADPLGDGAVLLLLLSKNALDLEGLLGRLQETSKRGGDHFRTLMASYSRALHRT